VTARLGLGLPLATSGEDPARFVAELLAEVRTAEESGFDLCLVPEHHHGPAVSVVSPLTLVAAMAARTTRIRIGSGVLILPLHHPLHVAEQLIMLDHISGGRVVLGVGAGYQRSDFAAFGVDMGHRGALFEDALVEIGALLSEPGRIGPSAVQRPRPPIWVGAWSGVGVRRAARLADGWIGDPVRTTGELAEMAARYRAACTGPPGPVVVMREAWVDDRPGARNRFAAVIEPVFRYYRRQGAAELPETFEQMAEDRFVFGGPDDCAEQLAQIAKRTDADTVLVTLRHPGGPDHATVQRGIRQLGAAWRARAGEGAVGEYGSESSRERV
jgi:alkanesulfonate monooxygenase SsuD/methylene tetrahydromethanopterin reductase-like flavin-dependent oxidoreductase (luciferase family)